MKSSNTSYYYHDIIIIEVKIEKKLSFRETDFKKYWRLKKNMFQDIYINRNKQIDILKNHTK